MEKFNKEQFAKLLAKAKGKRSINHFANSCRLSAAHISRLLRQLLDSPPNVDTIKKIALNSKNQVGYYELMKAAGYLPSLETSINETGCTYQQEKSCCKSLTLYTLSDEEALGEPECSINISVSIAGDADWVIHVTTQAFASLGIYQEDRLLIKEESQAEAGQTILTQVEDQLTIKRYYPLENQVVLEPSIPSLILPYDQIQIKGIVVAIWRQLPLGK